MGIPVPRLPPAIFGGRELWLEYELANGNITIIIFNEEIPIISKMIFREVPTENQVKYKENKI